MIIRKTIVMHKIILSKHSIIESSLRVHANVQSMPTVSRLCCLIHRAVLIPAMVRATATDITIWADEALSSVLSWSPVKNERTGKVVYTQ